MMKNALFLFAVAVMILVVFLPSYKTMEDLKQKNRDYAQKIAELEAKNKEFEEERRKLQTNPEYIEKVGRETMGLVRPGETVYKLVPQQQK